MEDHQSRKRPTGTSNVQANPDMPDAFLPPPTKYQIVTRTKKQQNQSDVYGDSDVYSYSDSSASISESDSSNADESLDLSESFTPLFKAIWNNQDKITALQRTELLAGKPQDPIVVFQQTKKECYTPGKLPNDFKNSTLWRALQELLEDVLPLKVVEVPHRSTCYWVWSGSEEITNQKTLLLKMVRKYADTIPDHLCEPVVDIMRAFLHTPPFSNIVGKQAAYSLLYLCRELVRLHDVEKWSESGICVGGGALGYEGSYTFARFTAPSACEDVAKYLAEKCHVLDNKGKQSQSYTGLVPDIQVFSLAEKDIAKSYGKVYLNIEVQPDKQTNYCGQKQKMEKLEKRRKKEIKSELDAATRIWMQALAGLAKSDTSYGILIKPTYARIYELCIEDSPSSHQGNYKCLLTSTKTFNFAYTSLSQSVLDLIEAIVCIMKL